MDHAQLIKALLKAPVVIDDDIWDYLNMRNRRSIKAIRHLAALLQDIYKILVFNLRDKVYFFRVQELKDKRLKIEIEFVENDGFIIKVSQDTRN